MCTELHCVRARRGKRLLDREATQTNHAENTCLIQRQAHFAELLMNSPPVIVTTVGVPHATIPPPSSSALLFRNVPPAIVTLEPPASLLSPEQYTWVTETKATAQRGR